MNVLASSRASVTESLPARCVVLISKSSPVDEDGESFTGTIPIWPPSASSEVAVDGVFSSVAEGSEEVISMSSPSGPSPDSIDDADVVVEVEVFFS